MLKHQEREKGMLSKFKRLRRTQQERDNQLGAANDDAPESLHSLISEVREEYLSDLQPDEIPNSEISDISDSEIKGAGQDLIQAMELN